MLVERRRDDEGPAYPTLPAFDRRKEGLAYPELGIHKLPESGLRPRVVFRRPEKPRTRLYAVVRLVVSLVPSASLGVVVLGVALALNSYAEKNLPLLFAGLFLAAIFSMVGAAGAAIKSSRRRPRLLRAYRRGDVDDGIGEAC
jgi:hypothetical protein